MRKHFASFDFILDLIYAPHDLNAHMSLLGRDGNLTPGAAGRSPSKPMAERSASSKKAYVWRG